MASLSSGSDSFLCTDISFLVVANIASNETPLNGWPRVLVVTSGSTSILPKAESIDFILFSGVTASSLASFPTLLNILSKFLGSSSTAFAAYISLPQDCLNCLSVAPMAFKRETTGTFDCPKAIEKVPFSGSSE